MSKFLNDIQFINDIFYGSGESVVGCYEVAVWWVICAKAAVVTMLTEPERWTSDELNKAQIECDAAWKELRWWEKREKRDPIPYVAPVAIARPNAIKAKYSR